MSPTRGARVLCAALIVIGTLTCRAGAHGQASDAGRQLARCFVRWARALDHLRLPALRRLADNQPVDPNDPDGGHTGQNLLGLALMQVRDELIADIRTRLAALAPGT